MNLPSRRPRPTPFGLALYDKQQLETLTRYVPVLHPQEPGICEHYPVQATALNRRATPIGATVVSHAADGTVRIVWEDGKAMTYRLVKEGFPVSTLRDSLGGTWERQVLVQGNAVFTHPANGNRIVVPLR